MNSFEKFVLFLSTEMPEQQAPFMPFHFIMLAIIIGATVILCIKLKNCSDKAFRTTLFIFWIILFFPLDKRCRSDNITVQKKIAAKKAAKNQLSKRALL